VRAFEEVIRSWGHWGVLASIGLMWGTAITWLGAMLGALLAFALSRTFGRPFVEAVVVRRDWRTLDNWTGQHAAQMVFLARFLPVISFNLVNYTAGLTRMSWWTSDGRRASAFSHG